MAALAGRCVNDTDSETGTDVQADRQAGRGPVRKQ